MSTLPIPTDSIAAVREQFPGTRKWIYLETSARGLLPLGARDAMLRYFDGHMYEGGDKASMFEAIERVREKFARLIHAHPDEIAIVKNVSEGINAIVTSLPWQRGDNAVICTEIEHPNSVYALYNVRDRYGVEVRNVAPTAEYANPVRGIADAIDAKTRLVIVSSVTFTTGTRSDLDAIGHLCRSRGVLLLVDGAQSVGSLEYDARTTPVDAMTVAASKYLCGPYGLGFLYVRRERAETMQPGSLARYGVDLGDAHEGEQGSTAYRLMPGAKRFDVGSYNYAGANAVEVSLDLLAGIGVSAIEKHVLRLARLLTEALCELRLPVLSGRSAAHFSQIVLIGRPVPDAATEALVQNLHDYLLTNGVKASLRHGRLRFSFHFYNTEQEVNQVVALLRQRVDPTSLAGDIR
jgi:cysteine desulfurase/selenocysteine lyase